MHRRLALFAGLIAIATIGLLPALGLLPGEPTARSWAHSPREPAVAHAQPQGRWTRGSSASLALLRRVTAREAGRVQASLAACEHSAGHQVRRYRRCAVPSLERTQAFASANSHMLSLLVTDVVATDACRGRVLALSGSTGMLAQIALSTRMSGLDAAWGDVLAASRSIRGLAREASKQARGSAWATTCRARPAAPPKPGGIVA